MTFVSVNMNIDSILFFFTHGKGRAVMMVREIV